MALVTVPLHLAILLGFSLTFLIGVKNGQTIATNGKPTKG